MRNVIVHYTLVYIHDSGSHTYWHVCPRSMMHSQVRNNHAWKPWNQKLLAEVPGVCACKDQLDVAQQWGAIRLVLICQYMTFISVDKLWPLVEALYNLSLSRCSRLAQKRKSCWAQWAHTKKWQCQLQHKTFAVHHSAGLIASRQNFSGTFPSQWCFSNHVQANNMHGGWGSFGYFIRVPIAVNACPFLVAGNQCECTR